MNTRIIMTLASLFVLTGAGAVSAKEGGKPGMEHREKYLLLDQRLISSVDNAALKLGVVKKRSGNPVLKDELPWEIDGSHMYPNVVLDPHDKLYKCWYYSKIDKIKKDITPGPEATKQIGKRTSFSLLYATSKDGIHWDKPELNVYLYQGRPTSIVSLGTIEAGVYRDPYDPNPQRRYKMLSVPRESPGGRLYTSFSADGIHWSQHTDTRISTSGDAHNHVFWNPQAREYVAISRAFSHGKMGYDLDCKAIPWVGGFVVGQRVVIRATSKDFVKWSAPEIIFEYGHTRRQIYAMPSFYTHGIFIGLPMIYDTNQSYRKRLEEEKLTSELEVELKDAGTSMRIWPGLTWSPDTKNWSWIDQRGKALIPLSEDPESVEWGMIFAAFSPIILDDEIRIYYSAQRRKHGGWNPGWLGLATLRADGWAGYEPKDESKDAVVETQPIVCNGPTLSLAADAENGSIVVTLKDAKGNALAESQPLSGSKPYTPVQWTKDFRLSAHEGTPVRLSFKIHRAKLYAFKFDQ
tara:strand:- start:168 stop:1727 length:1560 start_codon:yes stop_codon:yes gene_type:complete